MTADKQELLEVLHRYCRAIDRRDYDLLRTVYHPDGIDDHGGLYSGPAEEFVTKGAPEGLAGFSITTHTIANALFKVDGDKAEGESYVMCAHITREDPPRNIVVSGRYLDKFVRYNGEWKIIHRSTIADWSNIEGGLDPNGPQGRIDREDRSYTFLSLFNGELAGPEMLAK